MNRVELLAPAGDLEKLKIAILYGADAVYCGGEDYSLRAGAKNMTVEDLAEGVDFAHQRGKKVYMTVNIFAHNEDLAGLETYLDKISDIPIDGYLISDPGIFYWFRNKYPDAEIHLSTQANTTNYMAAEFWHQQGIKRIVLARELSLTEIKEFRQNTSDTLELEAFIHGAMCISYSGRCLLSNFMVGRDANRGECTHPCRWKYRLMEEKRPGEYFPIYEDDRGSYLFNSKDLCMLQHIPELMDSGIHSFKLEGRSKSVFYVASVVGAYRKAIDAYYLDPGKYCFEESWLEEVGRASHRLYTTGFYFNKPGQAEQNYETSQYTRDYTFVGVIKDYDEATGFATMEQRNKVSVNDEIQIFGPFMESFDQRLEFIYDQDGELIDSAPHPQQIVKFKVQKPVVENCMVCTRK